MDHLHNTHIILITLNLQWLTTALIQPMTTVHDTILDYIPSHNTWLNPWNITLLHKLHNYRPWNHKIWLQSLPIMKENSTLAKPMTTTIDTTDDFKLWHNTWLCALTQQMNWPLGSQNDNSHLHKNWLNIWIKQLTENITFSLNITHNFSPRHNKWQQSMTHTWQHNLTKKITVIET